MRKKPEVRKQVEPIIKKYNLCETVGTDCSKKVWAVMYTFSIKDTTPQREPDRPDDIDDPTTPGHEPANPTTPGHEPGPTSPG